MRQLKISEFKQMRASEIKDILPCELLVDGVVIAEMVCPGAAIGQVIVKEVIKEVPSQAKPVARNDFFNMNG